MLLLDLSNNNPDPDWARLKKQGIGAVYLKASEGTTFLDKTYAERHVAARKAGLLMGAYHFARPDASDPEAQARWFVKAIGSVGIHDLRPALDFETTSNLWSSTHLVEWARRFNGEVKRLTGVLPVFYSYSSFIETLKPSSPIGAGLWLATYSRNDGKEHPFTVPSPWKSAVAHQFSSKCTIGGCEGFVDLSSVAKPNAMLAHPVRHRIGL